MNCTLMTSANLAVIAIIGLDLQPGLAEDSPSRRSRYNDIWKEIRERTRFLAEEVLRRAGTSSARELAVEPSNALWRAQNLDAAVRRILGPAATNYNTLHETLHARLLALAEKFECDRSSVNASYPEFRTIGPTEPNRILGRMLSRTRRIGQILRSALRQINSLDVLVRGLEGRPPTLAPGTSSDQDDIVEGPLDLRWRQVQDLANAADLAFNGSHKCECPQNHRVHVGLDKRIGRQHPNPNEEERLVLAVESQDAWKTTEVQFLRAEPREMHQRLRAGRDHCDRVTEIQSNRVLQLLLSKPDLLYEVRPARPIDHAPQFDAQHDISSMPLRSKQALNVVLASSVVQLSVAKWLGRFWTRDDLVFQRLPGGMKPLPYISFPQLGDPGMRGFGEKGQQYRHNASMLALGVFIAQTSCDPTHGGFQMRDSNEQVLDGAALKRTWGQDPSHPGLLIHEYLDEAVNKAKDSIPRGSFGAIERCMQLYFDPDFDLRKADKVRNVLDNIISPLDIEENPNHQPW